MESFKCIDQFHEKEENAWNCDGFALIDSEAWKYQDELEPYLVSACKDASVGHGKGMKKYLAGFITEVADLFLADWKQNVL